MSTTHTATIEIEAASAPTPPPARALVPLRRNWRFQTLWVGSASALTGVMATDVAYPLVILALTGSAGLAGLFGLIQAGGVVVFGLPAGQLVDRCDRRRVMIVGESVRVAATASVAVAFALHALTLTQLLVVGALVGAAQPFVGSARMLTVRRVVAPEQLTAALTQDELRAGVADLAGPPLGGLLYGLSRALPFLFSTIGFTVSLLAAIIVRPEADPTPTPASAPSSAPAGRAAVRDGGMFAGIRALWADPALRATLTLLFFLNFAGAPLTLAAVYRLTHQSTPTWGIGLALAGSAVGGLAGAALVRTLHRRFRPGTLLLAVTGTVAPLVIALGLVTGPLLVGLILFGVMLGIPAVSIMLDVLILRQVPDEVRGRTLASMMTVLGLGIPVGMGTMGLLLQYLGGTEALLALGGVLACAVAWATTQRGLRAARWPEA
ncbi:MFS transporter [Streptacidiphilus sp. EB129]|uniref:MFS transporter n=1 Tax=Streptacidiphilus sp. EB129 TaxID=3156262 RepID=UPI0035124C37